MISDHQFNNGHGGSTGVCVDCGGIAPDHKFATQPEQAILDDARARSTCPNYAEDRNRLSELVAYAADNPKSFFASLLTMPGVPQRIVRFMGIPDLKAPPSGGQ